MSVKITDLVDSKEIEKLKELDAELKKVLETYTNVAKDLAKGLEINVSATGDLERLERLLVDKGKEAAKAQEQLTSVIQEQGKVIANTSNTISRNLMEQEKLNKTQREEYNSSQKVAEILSKVRESYKAQVAILVQVNEQIKLNKAEQRDLQKQYEAQLITYDEYIDRQSELIAKERELGVQKAQLNQSLKMEEKANSDSADSIDKLSHQLEMLKRVYKELDGATRESEEGKEIEATIQQLDAHLKDMSADIGEFQRNVGNYAVANQSVKSSLKELVLEIANLTVQYQSLSEEEKNSAEGKLLAGHISDLTEKAGILKDAIADTNTAIANAASDTRTFDQLSGSIQLAIDGFGLAEGAAAMLGIGEEELAEIQTKLQAAIAASNAMQSIQNTLQSQSAVMQGVNLIQTKLRTTAENLHTLSVGKGVVATKALTLAQWAFNAAANANPIGVLIVLIVAAVAAVWLLVKAFQKFFGISDEVNKSLDRQIQKIESLKKANEELIGVLEASGASQARIAATRLKYTDQEIAGMRRVIEQAKKNHADKKKIAELEEELTKTEQDQLKQYESQYFGLEKVIREVSNEELKQKYGAAFAKKKLLDQEIEDQKMLIEQLRATAELYGYQTDKLDEALDALEKRRTQKMKEINKEAFNEAQSLMKDLQSAVRKGEDEMVKLISDSTQRKIATENLSYKRKIEDLRNEIKVTKATKKNAAQIIEALNVQIEAAEAQHLQNLESLRLESEQRTLDLEIEFNKLRTELVKENTKSGIEEASKLRLEALRLILDKELLELEKQLQAGTISEEEAQQKRDLLAQKYTRSREREQEETTNKLVELVEKQYTDEQTIRDNAYLTASNSLKQRYAEELAQAKGNAEKQEALKAKYEDNQARLTEQYAIESAQASIKMFEDILQQEGLTAEERLEYEKKLAKAKIELEEKVTEASISEMERTENQDKKTTEKRIANAQKWLQVAADSLNAINDLSSAIYDNKIAKVEEEQEALDASAENELNQISELVEKKVITEEEGEARKRAAEAKTAKKQEELEKKKQQLKYKQAVWDKANSAAQVGISTALAIMNALQMQPFPVGIAMAAIAGAMGAVQLATVLATPIPKYAKGTDRHKGGLAIVGDGGVSELVMFGGKSFITPDEPTLVDLPAGAIVQPDIDGIDPNTFTPLVVSDSQGGPQVVVNNDYRRLEEKMDRFISILKSYAKSQRQFAIDNSLNNYINSHL